MIRVRNLIKTYRSKKASMTALDRVSFEVEKGEFLALIGADGAGKTTLIKILCGMIPFDGGEVEILGRALPSGSGEIKHHIGYLSQRFALYGNLTVEENIGYFASIFGVKNYRPRMEELLDAMNLSRFRKRLSKQLSGGMKQKLGVVCGLIHSPEIMFLDEPTTGVDPVSRRELFRVVEDMSGQGLTVIMSTAYMDEAERAHTVLMLDNGRILESGDVRRLQSSTGCSSYDISSGAPDSVQERVEKLPRLVFSNVCGEIVHVITGPGADEKDLVKSLEGLDASIEKRSPSMEDLFINRILSAGG